jgi:hypothetical protein
LFIFGPFVLDHPLENASAKSPPRRPDHAGLYFMLAHEHANESAEIVSSCWPDAALKVARPEAV